MVVACVNFSSWHHQLTRPALSHERRSLLKLNCIVDGDDRSHIFQVEIARTDLVIALKKAIMNEKNSFKGFRCYRSRHLEGEHTL
jgi:hypothetical protein